MFLRSNRQPPEDPISIVQGVARAWSIATSHILAPPPLAMLEWCLVMLGCSTPRPDTSSFSPTAPIDLKNRIGIPAHPSPCSSDRLAQLGDAGDVVRFPLLRLRTTVHGRGPRLWQWLLAQLPRVATINGDSPVQGQSPSTEPAVSAVRFVG